MLFLTNSQARQLDLDDLDKFINAMDINPRPKLIINFLTSYAYDDQNSVKSTQQHFMSATQDQINHLAHGFVYSENNGRVGMIETDRRLAIFMRETILPVALQTNVSATQTEHHPHPKPKQTLLTPPHPTLPLAPLSLASLRSLAPQALVLLNGESCSLSRAFGNLVGEELAKFKGKCPFTVLNVGFASSYDTQSYMSGTVAFQLRTGSRRWRQNQRKINQAMENHMGKWRSQWSQNAGPPRGCSHYVLVDTVDDKKNVLDFSAAYALSKNLTAAFAKHLPSIGFVTFGHTGGGLANAVKSMANYVGRGLPLLILDSRVRPDNVNTLEECKQHLIDVEAKLNAENHVDFYRESTWSLVHSVLQRIEEREALQSAKRNTNTAGLPIWKILLDATEQEKHDSSMASSSSRSSLQGKKEELTRAAVDLVTQLEMDRGEHDKVFRTAYEKKHLESFTTPKTFDEIDAILISECKRWCLESKRHPNALKTRSADVSDNNPSIFTKKALWLPRVDGKCKVPWCEVLSCRRDKCTFEEALAAFNELIEKWKTNEYFVYVSDPFESQTYLSALDLLKNRNTYSCNIGDLEGIKATIKRVAKTDRYPTDNTLEGMQILQSTWDKIDVFNDEARKHKMYAKAFYATLLILGAAVSIITVVAVNNEKNECLDKKVNKLYGIFDPRYTNKIVLGLTLLASVIAALITYLNPGTKWQQLRGAALALECEIWKFRSRVGEYGGLGDNRGMMLRDAEVRLQSYSELIKQHVIKSATVMNTSFLAKFDGLIPNSKNKVADAKGLQVTAGMAYYKHGQYPRAGVQGTFGRANQKKRGDGKLSDDHHSPVSPETYLELRVATQLAFFQTRLPVYSRGRFYFEAILVFGSLTGTILAFLGLSSWAAISTAITASCTAYAQFQGTEKKLLRYSDGVSGLDSILLWWRSLTDVERASMDAKTQLVTSCESIFQSERQGWVTTNMSQKLLTKKANEASDGMA